MTKLLGPWQDSKEYPGSSIIFADPHDGRVWELDNQPMWIACVNSCCMGKHWPWMLSDRGSDGNRPSGNEPTREEALTKANEALRQAGWTLPHDG